MSNNLAERRSSSVSANLTSLVVPKAEPMEEEVNLNRKRHFDDPLSNDSDRITTNKRPMATKKHSPPSEGSIGRMTNGRATGNIDEQNKANERNRSPNSPNLSHPKMLVNGSNTDLIPTINTASKPR